MLFEIAVAAAEQLLGQASAVIDWDACLTVATQRQRRHFDAELPGGLLPADVEVATRVADNLVRMLKALQAKRGNDPIEREPHIPGYQWIASGTGDFAIGRSIVEVKCTAKRFASADYRQVLMYWMLTYASSVETGAPDWSEIVLLNPRKNWIVELTADTLIAAVAVDWSKVELLELFSALIGKDSGQVIAV